MAYQLIEASLADLDRLYRYHMDGVHGTEFSIKGFDYPWLLTSHVWKEGEKVLDVGPAYSPLPAYLQKNYSCGMWAADDFGSSVGDGFWSRGRSPHEFIESHPEVNYVLERLGDPSKSSLPTGYFDLIYSLSVLEHVPPQFMPSVLKHMDLLLKPGGEMLHAVDLLFPSNGGLKKLFFCLCFDLFHAFIPQRLKQKHNQATPLTYLRQVAQVLEFRPGSPRGLDVLTMTLSPTILVENYHIGLNRIVKDGLKDYHFQRYGSLLLRLKKIS